uniref:Uncharacterized protein n=1 Tax=Cacopsylla melanoneura TaxID=428564 RepID=A0A8D8YPW5_9HEMI
MFSLLLWSCALSVCYAFYIHEQEATRFEDITDAKDAIYTTLEPLRHWEADIDFHKGIGEWHTPTRRRKNVTLSFEQFCVKYFPQYTSTPNWADYDTYPFTLPPNKTKGEILRAFMKFTVHTFEVEEYFREHKRKTWFSMEDTYEKEAWRGWTTTAFYPDLLVYNPNVTWAPPERMLDHPDMGEVSFQQTDLSYESDPIIKDIERNAFDPDKIPHREKKK